MLVADPPMQSLQLMNQPNDELAANVLVPDCALAPPGFDSWIRVESTMTRRGPRPGRQGLLGDARARDLPAPQAVVRLTTTQRHEPRAGDRQRHGPDPALDRARLRATMGANAAAHAGREQAGDEQHRGGVNGDGGERHGQRRGPDRESCAPSAPPAHSGTSAGTSISPAPCAEAIRNDHSARPALSRRRADADRLRARAAEPRATAATSSATGQVAHQRAVDRQP